MQPLKPCVLLQFTNNKPNQKILTPNIAYVVQTCGDFINLRKDIADNDEYATMHLFIAYKLTINFRGGFPPEYNKSYNITRK